MYHWNNQKYYTGQVYWGWKARKFFEDEAQQPEHGRRWLWGFRRHLIAGLLYIAIWAVYMFTLLWIASS